ncbi:hypothetical protein GA0070614_0623 [Micromonospora coxensis]|uniref:Uncharacterized protein n=1 Tax=Micromonospora coxensis TaxID=356852 RepID=A0A1C5H0F0_9ACTN|nr:hypothetical protein GA0070614_0623 [Micromonospora coxensis]
MTDMTGADRRDGTRDLGRRGEPAAGLLTADGDV